MNTWQSFAVIYLVNSLWQIPLIFAAAWIAARLLRPVSSQAEHRIWVYALLVEVIVPACQFDGNAIGRNIWTFLTAAWGRPESGGNVQVIVNPGVAADSGALHLSAMLLNGTFILYAIAVMYFALRLCWGLWRTHVMLRDSEPIRAAEDLDILCSLSSQLLTGRRDVHFAASPMATGPVTLGIRRGVLLFPKGFLRGLPTSDLESVLAHELAHVQRRDFLKNLFYSFVSLPVAYHPLLRLTASNLAATREIVCDAMAANSFSVRERYAQSLLRLAAMLSDRVPVKTLNAIGIFDANVFERRIMRLTQKQQNIGIARRMAVVAVAAIVGLAACTSAIALGIRVSPVSTSVGDADGGKTIHVDQGTMKLITKVQPEYPPDAKAAGIKGTVVLQAIINRKGIPVQIRVQSGRKEFQKSAIDAVRQWRWEPYLLNGDPVEVDTSIKIVFSLGR